jgi:hypothetical protein
LKREARAERTGTRWHCVHPRDNRTTANTTMLRTIMAIPTASMMKARLGLNAMRHRWSAVERGSVDLDHAVLAPAAICTVKSMAWEGRFNSSRLGEREPHGESKFEFRRI